jgi:hypothetical protein
MLDQLPDAFVAVALAQICGWLLNARDEEIDASEQPQISERSARALKKLLTSRVPTSAIRDELNE